MGCCVSRRYGLRVLLYTEMEHFDIGMIDHGSLWRCIQWDDKSQVWHTKVSDGKRVVSI